MDSKEKIAFVNAYGGACAGYSQQEVIQFLDAYYEPNIDTEELCIEYYSMSSHLIDFIVMWNRAEVYFLKTK